MGHLGQQNISRLPVVTTRVDFKRKIKDEYTCECCVLGRQRAVPHDLPTEPGTKPGEFIFSDLSRPITPVGFDGSRYIATFNCDYTAYSYVFPIAQKSDTFTHFRWLDGQLEASGRKIGRVRMDNGGEYISKAFLNYLHQRDIRNEPTVARNPEMNGAAERFGQTLIRKVYPMLLGSGLNKTFWPELAKTANYLTVRSPS